MKLKIDTQKCVGCGICGEGCPLGLLTVKNRKSYVKEGCTACGECLNLCICSALSIEDDCDSVAEMNGIRAPARTKKSHR